MPKKTKIENIKVEKKFKLTEKGAENVPTGDKKLDWEGEQVEAYSDTKISDDKGTGNPVVLRTFQFGVNPEAFKQHKPTAQELFESHRRGIEALLWQDGMAPFQEVQPRLTFSKNKKFYSFIIACLPREVLVDTPQTLSQLLTNNGRK